MRIVLWRTQCYHIHFWSSRLRRRTGRVSAENLWTHWYRRPQRRSSRIPATILESQPLYTSHCRRRWHVLHARQRYGTQHDVNGCVRCHRGVLDPPHILRRRWILVLFLYCPWRNHLASQGARVGEAIQDMDHNTHRILLCEHLLVEQGCLCAASSGTHCCRICPNRCSGILPLGEAKEPWTRRTGEDRVKVEVLEALEAELNAPHIAWRLHSTA